MTGPVIHLSLAEPFIHLRPTSFLGEELFARYRETVEGARFDRASKSYRVAVDRVYTVIERLRERGFACDPDPDVRRALLRVEAVRWSDLDAARDRIAWIDQEIRRVSNGQKFMYAYQKTGSQWLTQHFAAALLDDQGLGKAQPLDEPVLTPDGWRAIGDLAVGDLVIGSGGRPTKVLGVLPQGVREQFKMTLADGRWTRCDLQHLWLVSRGGEDQITTFEMVKRWHECVEADEDPGRLNRFRVPVQLMGESEPRAGRLLPFAMWVNIRSIESVGLLPCVCIRVKAVDQLYVTRDFILTHNSLQSLAAIPSGSPVLVTCPKSLQENWIKEVRLWRPQLAARIASKATFQWSEPNELVVINFEGLPAVHGLRADGSQCDGSLPAEPCTGCRKVERGMRVVVDGHLPSCDARGNKREFRERCDGCHPFLGRMPERLVVIVDEASKLKNPKTIAAERVRCIATTAQRRGGRGWEMTGTPIENRPEELWHVLSLVDLARATFGSFDNYVRLFQGERQKGRGIKWGEPLPEVAERMRRHSKRRMKRDVLKDLPKKIRVTRTVEIDKQLIRDCEAFLASQGKSADEVARLLVEEKIPFTLISKIRTTLAVAKIPAMLEYVADAEERGAPLLVFSAHRAPIDALQNRPGWRVITGDTTKKGERQAYVDLFQQTAEEARALGRETLKGLGLTIETGAYGFTLTRATEEYFVDLDYRPGRNLQCEDRALRIGSVQENGLLVVVSHAEHPLDIRIQEIILEKMLLIEKTVDASAEKDDVPDAALDARLREMRVAVAMGRPVRRPAESAEERRALALLSERTFEDEADTNRATDLVEEAVVMQLTDAQWRLVHHLAGKQ